MKTIKLLSTILCFVVLPLQAQTNIIAAYLKLMNSKGVEVTRNIESEKIGKKMIKVSEVYAFSMPKNKINLIQNVIDAFNEDSYSNNCYLLKQHSGHLETSESPIETYHIAIGSKPESGRFVKKITIGGLQGVSYIVACFMDTDDGIEGWRHCYALEWQDINENGRRLKTITGRLIMTYSEIVDRKNNSFLQPNINLPQNGTFNFLTDKNQILMTFLGIKTAILNSTEERLEQFCLLMKSYVEQHAEKVNVEDLELWCGELENLCNHIETKYFDLHSLGISYLRAALKTLKQILEQAAS